MSNSAPLRHVFREFSIFKMVFSVCKNLRIVFYHLKGIKAPEIEKRLLSERMTESRRGIHHQFIKMYKLTGSIGRRPGSGRRSKVTMEIEVIVNKQMKLDDETSHFIAVHSEDLDMPL